MPKYAVKDRKSTSVVMDIDVWDLAQRLAKKERRSFSSMLEIAVLEAGNSRGEPLEQER